jgi:predicted MFS family arabinose efflux permease
VTPQLLLPLVGDLAPSHRRASSLAVVVSGLSLGILVARVLGGVLAAYTAWRNIYWFGLGMQWLVFGLLYYFMPDYPSKNPEGGLTYAGMLWSIPRLLLTQPLLLQAALIAFCSSAVFTAYWTTLSFLLSSPPYQYSALVIGLFGLIGVVVIFSAPVYGRLVLDRFVPLFCALVGLSVELAGLFVGTFTGTFSTLLFFFFFFFFFFFWFMPFFSLFGLQPQISCQACLGKRHILFLFSLLLLRRCPRG